MKYKHGLCIVSLVLLSAGTLLGQGFDSDSGESGESGFSPPYSRSSGSSGSSSSGSGSSGSSSSGSSGSFIDPPSNSNPPSGGSSQPNTPSTPAPDPYLIDPPQSVIDFVHQVALEYPSRLRNVVWMLRVIGEHDTGAADDMAEAWEHFLFSGAQGIQDFPKIYLLDPAVTYIEEDGQRVKDTEGYTYNPFTNQYYDEINGNVVAYANLPDVSFTGAYNRDTNTIYLSQDLFASGSDPAVARDIIIQEIAHYLDFNLSVGWGQEDHNGSEGILASMSFDDLSRFSESTNELRSYRSYKDHATLFWPGNGGVNVELGFWKKLKHPKKTISQMARNAADEINHAGHALVRAGSEVAQVYEDAILAEYGEAAHLFDEARDFYNAHSKAIEIAGMVALLLLSGPELVGSFGVGTPAVVAEDSMLFAALLGEASEGVDAAVLAADAVEDAYIAGDTAVMAEQTSVAVQTAVEVNATYAEASSEMAELSGDNIEFFLQTIEDFGEGDPDLIADHISMISDEGDEIEEAAHGAQSSYLAAEQSLDAAEDAGTLTAEQLEVVEDAVQEAADEAAEATSEAAEADAAEAEANSALAEETLDDIDAMMDECPNIAPDADPFATPTVGPPPAGGMAGLINRLKKIKEATFMGVARMLGVMPVVPASPTCSSQALMVFLQDSWNTLLDSQSAVTEAEDQLDILLELADDNPSLNTLRALQQARSRVASAYQDIVPKMDRLRQMAIDLNFDNPNLVAFIDDTINGSINFAADSASTTYDIFNAYLGSLSDLRELENAQEITSGIDQSFSSLWSSYQESIEDVENAQSIVDGMAQTTQEEIDAAADLDETLATGRDSLDNAANTFSDGFIEQTQTTLQRAMDRAIFEGQAGLNNFLEAGARWQVLSDLSIGNVTTADTLATDLTTALRGIDAFADETVNANEAQLLLDSANSNLNISSVDPAFVPGNG